MSRTAVKKNNLISSCWFLGLMLLLGLAPDQAVGGEPATSSANSDFFEQQVRPLLVARCYECHSSNSKPLQGNLLLDSKAGWQHGGDSGPAIVPSKPADSLLVRAVRYTDENVQMPPSGKLDEREIAVLERWVALGAPDPRTQTKPAGGRRSIDLARESKHWAYQPLARTSPPMLDGDSWSRTPIDRFIQARLREHKLPPNPAADRRRLIRRAYFDLLGLPPGPEEVEAFVRDPAADAYERLIDRLLDSPHYGERWGRHWLDLARFAESHGFEQDYDRPNAYHYRDFVIKALNQDLPYNTFVRWQIAGDEYDPDNPLAMAATGFLAAGVHATQITANQAEKERYDELDDITRTIGTTMLGLTVGCARCHDHKFDPFTSDEYYRMAAAFTTTVRSDYDVSLDAAGDRRRKAEFDRVHDPLVAARREFETREAPARLERWCQEHRGKTYEPGWLVLDAKLDKSDGTRLTLRPNGSLLAGGASPLRENLRLSVQAHAPRITALRLEALPDESLPGVGPGRGDGGAFELNEFVVRAKPITGKDAPQAVKLGAARHWPAEQETSVAALVDGKFATPWSVAHGNGLKRTVILTLGKPLDASQGVELSFELVERSGQKALGRFRLSAWVGAGEPAAEAPSARKVVLAALARAGGDEKPRWTASERAALSAWICEHDGDWRKLNDRVLEHARSRPPVKSARMLISSEGVPAVRLHTQGPDFYDKTYFLTRGDPNVKRGEASPGFLKVLTSATDGESHWLRPPPQGSRTSFRRHALAEWMTDTHYGAGQLLARVMANRLWHYHFGRGIVPTPSDFGTQGERPTHPELLDWLAWELIEQGWRLKPLHKLIMTSSTYMQGSQTDAARLRVDLGNRWFWHRPLERLEAEVIRDNILAVSGELDRSMFGPGTLEPAQKRRSIYFFVKRSRAIPMMLLFDAPDPLQDMAQRQTTTIAPQALLLVNSPIVRGYAEAFARRLLDGSRKPADDAGLVERAYQLALSRSPAADEAGDARAFVAAQTQSYAPMPAAKARQAAVADFCQVLFGLNEFIYVE